MSTSLKMPARTKYALLPSSSSATPGHSISVPGRCSRSITFLTASAAAMLSGTARVVPFAVAGAPSMIGSC